MHARPRLSGRLTADHGKGPHREGPHAADFDRDGIKAESTIRELLESSEVFDDGDARTEQRGVNWAMEGCGIVDIEGVDADECRGFARASREQQREVVDRVCRRNVERSVESILSRSEMVARRVQSRELAVIGALYDVASGRIELLSETANVAVH